MKDNIIAIIIFIIAIIGLIALVVYKMRKTTNQKITIDGFIDIYYQNLFSVIQDVVLLLAINVEDFETKEDYERAIISTTIAKLEENCDEFGINSTLFKLIDKEILSNVLYDILYTNKVQIFFSTLTEKVIKTNPELYDKEVIEAFENAEPVLNENNNTHTEPQEEHKHEEEEIVEQEEATSDISDDEKNEEVKEETEFVNDEATALPPRAELEIISDISPDSDICVESEPANSESLSSVGSEYEIFNDPNTFTAIPEHNIEVVVPIAETAEQLASLANIPNADLNSYMHSIEVALNEEHVEHE